MKIKIRLPQLDAVLIDLGSISDNVAACLKKLEALTPATAAVAADPVRVELPLNDKPSQAPKAKRTPRKAIHVISAALTDTHTVTLNGEDRAAHEDDDDEDTLRARVSFEAKRVSRNLGIGGMRAAIRKATGENILQVDDVPTPLLQALLSELQAM